MPTSQERTRGVLFALGYYGPMSEPVTANIGGWIGRGIANGEPSAFIAVAAVAALFLAAYRLTVWWRTQ